MSALVFLVAVVVLTLVGAVVLWLRDREPRSMDAHMRAFEREREALSPDTSIEQLRRRRVPSRPRTRGPGAG